MASSPSHFLLCRTWNPFTALYFARQESGFGGLLLLMKNFHFSHIKEINNLRLESRGCRTQTEGAVGKSQIRFSGLKCFKCKLSPVHPNIKCYIKRKQQCLVRSPLLKRVQTFHHFSSFFCLISIPRDLLCSCTACMYLKYFYYE